MSLPAGSHVGPYEILAPIRASNGSDAYKASDTRAGQTVALHLLPSDWDTEKKQRFEREAKIATALNHPHICAPQEIGQQDGIDFFVTEHLEGRTLDERLAGKPMGLGEILDIAIAVADALNNAHRAGLVHSDLRPANVMLTDAGAKLLGFGLAPAAAESRPPNDALTFEYSAPEQLEGKPADARSDIFSFGAILHEMAAGKKAFEGKSRAVLIAAIKTVDPDPLSKSRPGAPPALEHVVQRCLEKDPQDRWQTAHDLLARLRWIAEGGGLGAAAGGTRARLIRVAQAAAAVLVAALALPAALYFRGPAEPDPFQLRVPVAGLSAPDVALSPDGTTIALVSRPTAQEPPALYVRRVGSVSFQRLGGTDDASQPFWSPDSRWIGFLAGGRIKKVSAAGGAPKDITGEAQGFSGGAWNRDGVILFGSSKGLLRVSAEGGKPAAATTVADKESGHYWPSFLPDGRRFLYLAWSGQAASRAVFVGKLDSQDKTRLMTAESNTLYAAPGYVVFHRQASLFAQEFDPDDLTLSGEPVHLADEVSSTPGNGHGNFDVSQTGSLIYFQGTSAPAGRAATLPTQWGWVDRAGSPAELAGEPDNFGDMDVSPDAKLIAVTKQEAGPGADIWVIDWQRGGVNTRLTLDPADDINPVWSPDGKRIAFTSYRKGNADIYVIEYANGAGKETPLLESSADEIVEDWSKDGRYIAFLSGEDNSRDIWALPLTEGEKKPFPVVQGRFQKNEPQFSYDGKWLAYTSDKTVPGQFQVYVRSFPAGDQELQVSVDGGGQPRWTRNGKLYFRSPIPSSIMEVDIKPGARLDAGVPRELFTPPSSANTAAGDPTRHQLAVTADGQRFLLRNGAGFGGPGGRGGKGPGGRGGKGPGGNPATPQAPFVPQAQGAFQGGKGRAARFAGTTTGLTVIQHWPSGIGKEKR
jgi:Tol biopolymer transport system component